MEEYKKELDLPEVCEQLGEHFDGLLSLMTAPAVVFAGVLRDIISGHEPTAKLLNMVTPDNLYQDNANLFIDSNKCVDPLHRPKTKEQPPKHGSFVNFEHEKPVLSTRSSMPMDLFGSNTLSRKRDIPTEDLIRSKYKIFGGGTITLIGAYNKASCAEEEAINVVRRAPFICSGIIMDKNGEIFEVIPDAYEHCKNKIVKLNAVGITHRTNMDIFKGHLKMFKEAGWKSNVIIKSVQRKVTKLMKTNGMSRSNGLLSSTYGYNYETPSWHGTNVGAEGKSRSLHSKDLKMKSAGYATRSRRPEPRSSKPYKSKWAVRSLLNKYGNNWDKNLRHTADALGLGLAINAINDGGGGSVVTITTKSEEAARRVFHDCPRGGSDGAIARAVTGLHHPKYASEKHPKFKMPESRPTPDIHHNVDGSNIVDMSDVDQSASVSAKYLKKTYGNDWQNKVKNAVQMLGTEVALGHDGRGTLKVYPKSTKDMNKIIQILDQKKESDVFTSKAAAQETAVVEEIGVEELGSNKTTYVKYEEPPTTYNHGHGSDEPSFTYANGSYNSGRVERVVKPFHTHADHVHSDKAEEVGPKRVEVEKNDDFIASMNPATGKVSIKLSEQALREKDVDAVLESLMGKLSTSDYKAVSEALSDADDDQKSSISSMKKFYKDFVSKKKKRRKKNVPKRKKQGKSR